MESYHESGFSINVAARQAAQAFVRATFDDTLKSEQDGRHLALENQRDRFKIWAGNLGVFATGNASADARLSTHVYVKDVVVKLLNRLRSEIDAVEKGQAPSLSVEASTRIEPASETGSEKSSLELSDETDSELSGTSLPDEGLYMAPLPMTRIDEIITNLYKITAVIKKPHSTKEENRIKQWNSQVQGNLEDELTELGKHVRWIIEMRMPRLHSSPELLDRVVESIVHRRKRLLYKATHRARLIQGVEDWFIPRNTASVLQSENRTPNPSQAAEPAIVPSKSTGKAVTFVGTQASSVRETGFSGWARSVALSEITPSVKEGLEELTVPPPPRPETNMSEVICPYCNLPLGRDVLEKGSGHRWTRHVLRDIEPYICLFPDCATSQRSYRLKEDWISHMAWQHTAIWFCQVQGHENLVFASEGDFIAHLKTDHVREVASDEMSQIVEKCRKPLPSVFGALMSTHNKDSACPICLDPNATLDVPLYEDITLFSAQSEIKIQDHVARHLEFLALFSLPARDDLQSRATSTRVVTEHMERNQRDLEGRPEPIFDEAIDVEMIRTAEEQRLGQSHPNGILDGFAEDWSFFFDMVGDRFTQSPLMDEDATLKRFVAAQEKEDPSTREALARAAKQRGDEDIANMVLDHGERTDSDIDEQDLSSFRGISPSYMFPTSFSLEPDVDIRMGDVIPPSEKTGRPDPELVFRQSTYQAPTGVKQEIEEPKSQPWSYFGKEKISYGAGVGINSSTIATLSFKFGFEAGKTRDIAIRCDKVETKSFTPDMEYISNALKDEAISKYVSNYRRRSVFMVTGIKTVPKGHTLRIRVGSQAEHQLHGGVGGNTKTAETPLVASGDMSRARDIGDSFNAEKTGPLILAYKLMRIRKKRFNSGSYDSEGYSKYAVIM